MQCIGVLASKVSVYSLIYIAIAMSCGHAMQTDRSSVHSTGPARRGGTGCYQAGCQNAIQRSGHPAIKAARPLTVWVRQSTVTTHSHTQWTNAVSEFWTRRRLRVPASQLGQQLRDCSCSWTRRYQPAQLLNKCSAVLGWRRRRTVRLRHYLTVSSRTWYCWKRTSRCLRSDFSVVLYFGLH